MLKKLPPIKNPIWAFRLTSSRGDNDPTEIFYTDIVPLLREHGFKIDDISKIAKAIYLMCRKCYDNGKDIVRERKELFD